jgi:signal transduction histidine kinase
VTLRTRISLALVGIALLLLVPALYGLANLRELEGIVRDLQGRNAAAILALGNLQGAVREVDHEQRIYLAFASQPEEDRRATAERVTAQAARAAAALGDLEALGFGEAAAEPLRRWRGIEAAIGEQRRLVDAGEVAAADAHQREVVAPSLAAFEQVLDDLGAALDRRGRQQALRATDIASEAARQTLLTLPAALLAALLVGAALTRSIVRPLGELRRATGEVGRGEFRTELPRVTPRRDELGELGRSFRAMAGELAELDRLKAEFVSVASHELKTPLSVIKGYVTLLRAGRYGQPGPRGQEVLATVDRQVDHLDRMIRRLLDVSRFEAGGGRLELAEVELGPFLDHLAVSFEPLALQSRIDFRLERQAGLPAAITADPDRLNEVIGNLLSNAFKFTPEGGTILLGARPRDEGEGVEVEVRDSGRGIPPEALPRVFEKFYQVEGGGNGRDVGSGLGLAIARHIVEAHGGTISAQSEVGRGTSFKVVLPAAPPVAGTSR